METTRIVKRGDYIKEEFQIPELNAISRRNNEIIKTHYSFFGFKNIQADYLIKGMGFGGKLRDKIHRTDIEVLRKLADQHFKRKTFVVDLFIYQEDMSNYFFCLILDEKFLSNWKKWESDKEILSTIAANFKVVLHPIFQTMSEVDLDAFLKDFSNHFEVNTGNSRNDDHLSLKIGRFFDISLRKEAE
jgi:hypothetical protein